MTDGTADPAIVLQYDPAGQAERRVVFRPIETDEQYLREEQIRDHDGTWRVIGSERVTEVLIETPAADD
jgi:hypothetical protein